MTLYALRSLAAGQFQMAKLDADMNVEATYTLIAKGHSYSCNCLASYRGAKLKPCKHQRMMPYMMGAVNLPRFFDPDTGRWAGLIEVAPGMRQEHEDGIAATAESDPQRMTEEELVQALAAKGYIAEKPEMVEPASGRLDAADKSSDDAQPEEAQANGEPATPTPVAGQATSPPQPERPVAPAPAAPVVVRMRI